MSFLVNSGAAVMANNVFPLDEALYELMNNPWRLELLEKCVAHIGKPDSTQRLCEEILANYEKNTVTEVLL